MQLFAWQAGGEHNPPLLVAGDTWCRVRETVFPVSLVTTAPTWCQGPLSPELRVWLQVHLSEEDHHGGRGVPDVLELVLDVFDDIVTVEMSVNTLLWTHCEPPSVQLIISANKKLCMQ